MKKLWILPLVLFILMSACSAKETEQKSTPTPIPTPVIPTKPTYKVQRGTVEQKIKFTGRIVPVIEQELFFGVGGRVDEVFVQQGDDVSEGQLIAVLETGNREFDLKRAQTHLELAQLGYEATELQTPKYSNTYSITMAIKEKEVELAQINLDELNKAVADARIVSPMQGRIRSLRLSEGSVEEAFQPIVVVSDLSSLEISADVGGDTMTKLTEGVPVTINPVVLEGEVLDGMIETLPYPYGSGAKNSIDQSVRISSNSNLIEAGYKPGDLVEIIALLEQRNDILWLPPQAIRTFEGRKFVVIKEGDGQRRIDVRTGLQSEDRVEIIEGLEEGDVVLSP